MGKKQKRFTAIDIGAGSGRVMLGRVDEGKLHLEESARFANPLLQIDGLYRWDFVSLANNVALGLQKARAHGKLEACGVDTWGVDFALLDEKGELCEEVRSYRNEYTQAFSENFRSNFGAQALYERTGIQHQHFNTLYQVYAMVQTVPGVFEKARRLLLAADYLHFCLSGVEANEFTLASTTGLLNASTKNWDETLLSRAWLPRRLLSDPVKPGTVLGQSKELDCKVVLPASHDTGSGFIGVPDAGPGTVIIASGSWCLVGVERSQPDCSEAARQANFTNEGGHGQTVRFLKNRMGLWMLQGLRASFCKQAAYADLDFGTMVEAGKRAAPFAGFLDCNHAIFFNPQDMKIAIDAYLEASSQQLPKDLGAYVRLVEEGLALSFAETVDELRSFGIPVERISLVGGGVHDSLLCSSTASATGLVLNAGPVEATALGNLVMQMIGTGDCASVAEGRELIRRSFGTVVYEPDTKNDWHEALQMAKKVRAALGDKKI